MQVYESKEEWLEALNGDPVDVLAQNLGKLSFDPLLLLKLLRQPSVDKTFFLYCQGRCIKGFAIVLELEEEDDDDEDKVHLVLQLASSTVIARSFITQLHKYLAHVYDGLEIEITILDPQELILEMLVHDFDYHRTQNGLTKNIIPVIPRIPPQRMRALFAHQRQMQMQMQHQFQQRW
jgi:hypothetical protein